MSYRIDLNKLNQQRERTALTRSASDLCRTDNLFFIGANLPVFETLETMFESHCQAASGLFYLIFGTADDLAGNLDLTRQIRKNFAVRILARLRYLPTPGQIESIYLAGADMLDIPASDSTAEVRQAALTVFPNWTTLSSLPLNGRGDDEATPLVERLLASGILPLPELLVSASSEQQHNEVEQLDHLATQWSSKAVPFKAIRPLLPLFPAIIAEEQGGLLRGVIDRLQDRKDLAFAELKRHLRGFEANASLDSASL